MQEQNQLAVGVMGATAPIDSSALCDQNIFALSTLESQRLDKNTVKSFSAIILHWTNAAEVLSTIRLARTAMDRIPLVVINAPHEGSVVTSLFRAGVNDVICEGEDLSMLPDNLLFHIETARLGQERRIADKEIFREIGDKTRNLEDALEKLQHAYNDTLQSLVLALDSREHATGAHSKRVALFCLYICLLAKVPDDQLERIFRGALLHDFGKIAIPDNILLKPGKLTPEEFDIIKTHTTHGKSFMEKVDFLKASLDIPYYHHEKINGQGYPEGLSGDSIPCEARIFAIIDVYDALIAKRPYKDPMPHQKALDIIIGDAGSHFDPEIVKLFISVTESDWNQLWEMADNKEQFPDLLACCRRVIQGKQLDKGASV